MLSWSRRLLILILIFHAGNVTGWGAEPNHLPIEFQPYQVAIKTKGTLSAAGDAKWQAGVLAELPLTIERCIGDRWQVSWPELSEIVVPESGESPTELHAADLHVPDEEPQESAETSEVPGPLDIEFTIRLSSVPGQFQAVVSAFEPLWSRSGPAISITTGDVRELPTRIVATMHQMLRPQGIWERLDDEQVQLRIQGAAYAEPDPDLRLLRDIEVFSAWMVFYNRDGTLQRMVAIPWTLFEYRKKEADLGTVTVHSGLANPLGASPRGRVKLVAIAERSQWASTSLHLQAQSQPVESLVAHRIDLEQPNDDEAPYNSLITNRQGLVTIPLNVGSPWIWITARSGDLQLARVPIVPGSERELTLTVPDDRIRLRAEGQLQLLQGELVASVTERQGLILSAKAAAKRNDWDQVANLSRQLEELPKIVRFRDQLAGIRVSSIAAARQQQNRLAERRIQRMCDETEALLARYLADDKVRQVLEELAELKAATAAPE